MTSLAAEVFHRQYDANVDALQRGDAGDLALVQMVYNGAATLAISNMRLREVDGDTTSFFDMTIGSQSLSDLAAMPTTFAQSDEWANYTAANQALITLPPSELVDPRKLFTLAHEIGHTYDTLLVMGALACASQALITPQAEKDLDMFGPALESLINSTKHSPELQDDIHRLLAQDVPTVPDATEAIDNNINIYYTEHSVASSAISALRESAAWLRAISLVDAGHLHPGMTPAAMRQEAMAKVRTYDSIHDTTLHEATLLYALSAKQ